MSQSVPCIYPQARRDRLNEAIEQNSQLVAFLRDLTVHVDDEVQKKIDGFLDTLGDGSHAPRAGLQMPQARPDEDLASIETSHSSPDPGEADVSGSVGSNDDVDIVDEDLFRSRESRATGFIGQNSEIQWLRSLQGQTKNRESGHRSDPPPYGPPGSSREAVARRTDALYARRKALKPGIVPHVTDSTFYLDGDNLKLDVAVDPYELPLAETAEKLFDCYMQTIHTSFPILPDVFGEQLRSYNDSVKRNRPYQISEEWQAMLNLVLAIGAQYSHLTQAPWRSGERDHLVYSTRATTILGLDKTATALSAPTLSSVQATGLLSLYYLAIGQVSRAWMMVGMSLRFALAVGLHLRNDDPSASTSKKETLLRTWWGLYSIESLLCTLIGRPCIILNDQCTVPLPQAHTEGQSGDSSFHQSPPRQTGAATRAPFVRARVTISLIVQKALSKLYTPQTSVNSWAYIQGEIASLSEELEEWMAMTLPEEHRPVNSIPASDLQRERLLLSFQYYSAKILIYRPCLCRLERRIKGQSDASVGFNWKTAEACVEAAQAVTRLFPDEPNLDFAYQQSPWWCIVHSIMQAVAVLLLELSFGETHMTSPEESILTSVKKLVRWLRFLSVSNAVAERAFEVLVEIINTSAPRLGLEISDILAEINTDQRHTYRAYRYSESSAFSPHYTSSFPWVQGQTPFSDHLTAPDLGTPYSPTVGQQRSVPLSEGHQPDQQFMWGSDLQTPSMFSNPFFTDFDLPNPLDDLFSLDRDATMDDG